MPASFALLTIVILLFLNSKRLGRRDPETQSSKFDDLYFNVVKNFQTQLKTWWPNPLKSRINAALSGLYIII
jgi:hypothetical protein